MTTIRTTILLCLALVASLTTFGQVSLASAESLDERLARSRDEYYAVMDQLARARRDWQKERAEQRGREEAERQFNIAENERLERERAINDRLRRLTASVQGMSKKLATERRLRDCLDDHAVEVCLAELQGQSRGKK